VDDATAASAAAGWGGDRCVVLARGDDKRPQRAVGVSRSEWDSEADAIEAAEAIGKALDHEIVGTVMDHAQNRTRWLGLDGTVTWLERKGPSVVVVVGAPAWAASALGAEVWTASGVVPPAAKPRQPRPRQPSR
jgi:hypothetical protein